MRASVGRLLLPPTYFCTRSIFDAGTKTFVPPWNSSSGVPRPALLFPAASIPGSARYMREMDNVVPLAQFEKAIDDASQAAATGTRDVGAVKQLVAADDENLIAHQSESSRNRRSADAAFLRAPAASRRTRRAGGRASASVWQIRYTSCPVPIKSSSLRTLAMSPEKRSTVSIFRWHVVSRGDGDARSRDRRKLIQLLQHAVDRVKILRAIEPAEKVPPFGFQLRRLEQQHPASRGQQAAEMFVLDRLRVEDRDVDRIERSQAALTSDFETADRLDFVAKQLHANRLEPIGREDIGIPPRSENSPGSSTALVP